MENTLTLKNRIPRKLWILPAVMSVAIPFAIFPGASEAGLKLLTGTALDESASYILWEIRLPRILFSVVAGMILAVSGVIAQSLFRNPLAEPGLVGISAGSMTFAVFGIIASHRLLAGELVLPGWLAALIGNSFVAFAFLGGLLTSWLVMAFGKTARGYSMVRLLLSGIAINAFTMAFTGFMIFLADDRELRDITFWSLGSFGAANWNSFSILGVSGVAAMLVAFYFHKELDLLLLGEKAANDSGMNVSRVRTILLILISLIQGLVIAWSGMISFIALVAPHLGRLSFSASHRLLLASSAFYGGLLTLFADTLARSLAAPAELPLGILTGLIGAPYFLMLVRREVKYEH